MSDEFVQQYLDAPETKEALSWLKAGCEEENFRSVGELCSIEESIALIQRFYDCGAAEVLAVEIDIDEGEQNTGKLVIKLPDDANKRASVVSFISEINVTQGFEPVHDDGQTYSFVMLD